MTELEAIQLLVKAKELGITDEQIKKVMEQSETPQMTVQEMVVPFNLDDMTEEDILYWSSPYYDELQHNRELQMQKKDEEL